MTCRVVPLLRPHAARLAAVVTAVVFGLLAGAGTASAHASLVGTDPSQDEVLPAAPEQATLTFSEPVRLPDGAVDLYDADGHELPVQARSVDDTVVVSLPARLDNGTFVLSWRVVSADSHPISGALNFSIGAPSQQVAPTSQDGGAAIPVVKGIMRALLYVALFVSAGLALFAALFLPPNPELRRLRLRLRNATMISGELAVVLAVLLLPVTAAYQQGTGLSSLMTLAPWQAGLAGQNALVALLLAVGLGVAATALNERPLTGLRRWSALGGAAIALGSLAIVGHTRSYGPTALVVASDVTHVVIAAVWFGGLVGLVMSLPVLGGKARDAAVTVSRFSTVAAGTLAAIVVAGSLLAWRILGSWAALVQTQFGWLFLGKISIVALTVAIAGWNRYRLVPRITSTVNDPAHSAQSLLRRSVRLEAGLLVGVLLITGFLVDRTPELTPPAAKATELSKPDIATATVGSVRITANIRPGVVGSNTIILRIEDRGGKAIEPYAEPVVSLRSAEAELDLGTRPLSVTGPATYRLTAVIPAPATWTVAVSVRLSEFQNPVVELPVKITD